MIPSVEKDLIVPAPPARAFEVFWTEIAAWWPLDRHSLSAGSGHTARSVTIEPRLGGAITEVMHDGTLAEWGRITEWEPGKALAFTWQLRRPETEATLVRVSFAAVEAGTRVHLVHSGWDAQGDDGARNRENYLTGWDYVLVARYGAAAGRDAA